MNVTYLILAFIAISVTFIIIFVLIKKAKKVEADKQTDELENEQPDQVFIVAPRFDPKLVVTRVAEAYDALY